MTTSPKEALRASLLNARRERTSEQRTDDNAAWFPGGARKRLKPAHPALGEDAIDWTVVLIEGDIADLAGMH